MKTLFFLAALISLLSISCKSKKETVKTSDAIVSTITTDTTAIESELDARTTYRLLVSFKSRGAGTDSEKRTAFLNYVNSHRKKLAYKTVAWGREGETDYCFNLSELTTKADMVDFLAGVKKIIAGSDLVDVSENAECFHQGR